MQDSDHEPALTGKEAKKNTSPTEPRWSVWQQSESCRIWQAVLLTLNIEPPSKSRGLCHTLSKDVYQKFKDRKLIAIRQYGVHSLLPVLPHHAQGEGKGERYVRLQDMIAFGQAKGWGGIENMASRLGCPSNGQATSPKGSEVSFVHRLEPESMPKGERYALVRMGALLEVLEKWIANGGKIPPSCIQAGKLNFSELERQAVAVIAEKASGKSKSGFGHGVFRKEYSAAMKSLQNISS